MNAIDNFLGALRRSNKRRQIFETVPARSKIMLLAMVFCLFSAVGMIAQLDSPTASQAKLWTGAIYSGFFAAAYLWIATHKNWLWMLLLFPVQIASTPIVFSYIPQHTPPGPIVPNTIKPWLETSSFVTLLLLSAAYILMMTFINREGERFFRTHTEIQLAGDIHKALVACIDRSVARYEFYGASLASGVVGGDLIDVIEKDGCWLAYVADVAGHGVSSGVLMAMIKSATNMGMRFDPEAKSLMAGINEVLCSLKTSNIFATIGFLSWSPEQGLHYSLAGHPSILLCRREVQWLSSRNLPVGLFPEATFESAEVDARPGDVLAILTDGLTEVIDRQGEELGIEAIASTLRDSKDRPLREIAAAIFQQADRHGSRTDDQSLLLVRQMK